MLGNGRGGSLQQRLKEGVSSATDDRKEENGEERKSKNTLLRTGY